MNTNKTSIKQTIAMLKISRTSLYNHMKSLNIKPVKEGGRVHLMDEQIDDLKAFLRIDCKTMDSKNEQIVQDEQINQVENIYKKQAEELKNALEKEQDKNDKLRDKITNLSQEVGRWQGRASTLEEQNIKLLGQSSAQKDTSTIIEANIVESEPEPEKKAEKIGFFQKMINFRF